MAQMINRRQGPLLSHNARYMSLEVVPLVFFLVPLVKRMSLWGEKRLKHDTLCTAN